MDSGLLLCPPRNDGRSVPFRFHEFVKSKLSLAPSGKSRALVRPARAAKRGVCAIVTERGAGCDGRCGVRRACSLDETLAAYDEVVWSWRRDRGVYFAGGYPADNGDNQRRSPGRARISRQTLRGESRDVSAVPVVLAHVLRTWDARALRRAGSTGAVSARLSLRPLRFKGTTRSQNSSGIAL